jgi:F-type H+-transporting ATPase subunit delta
LPAEVKAHRLAEVCGDELDSSAKLFLQALAEHNRLPLLPEVLTQFEELKAKEEESIDVEVLSAFELTETQVEEIKSTLNKRFDKQINIESSVDKTLIGGAIIRAGDLVIDGSARGKLTKLADTLTRS